MKHGLARLNLQYKQGEETCPTIMTVPKLLTVDYEEVVLLVPRCSHIVTAPKLPTTNYEEAGLWVPRFSLSDFERT